MSKLNKRQQETKNSLVDNRYTVDEMNAFLIEEQKRMENEKSNRNNKRVIELQKDNIVGIAAALVHAANQRDNW